MTFIFVSVSAQLITESGMETSVVVERNFISGNKTTQDSIIYRFNMTKGDPEVYAAVAGRELRFKKPFPDWKWGVYSSVNDVVIPTEISYDGKTYPVKGIGWNGLMMYDLLPLQSLTIPESVIYINDFAFWADNDPLDYNEYPFPAQYYLRKIVVDGKNPKYDSREDCNCIVETATNTLIEGCSSSFIPSSIERIKPYAFFRTSIENVTIPSSVNDIGSGVFFNCPLLKEVKLESNVTTIPDSMFCACYALENCEFPEFIDSIGDYAFYECCNLQPFKLSSSLKYIGTCAFVIEANLWQRNKGRSMYRDNKLWEILEIPEGVTEIGRDAFSYRGCEKIVLPSTLEKVGFEAFHLSATKIFIKATTPPHVDIRLMSPDRTSWQGNVTLYVPKGTLSLYENAEGWKEFFYIEEFDFENETGIMDIQKENQKKEAMYDLTGRKVNGTFTHGLYIKNGKIYYSR